MRVEIRVGRGVRADQNRVILDGHDITDAVRSEGLAVDLTDIDRPLVHLVLMPQRLDVDLADALVDVLQVARTERAEHHRAQLEAAIAESEED